MIPPALTHPAESDVANPGATLSQRIGNPDTATLEKTQHRGNGQVPRDAALQPSNCSATKRSWRHPPAAKSKWISLVNVRYFWEAGAQLKTQGHSLVVTATFPVPSIKIAPNK